MKKIFSILGLAFTMFLFLGITSCNNAVKEEVTVAVDTVKVDTVTVAIDTVKVDTTKKVEAKK